MTSTPGPPIKVAVVGVGGWGINHVRVWHDLGGLGLLYDVDPSRLATVQTMYPGIEVCSDLRDVLERPDIDAAVIATPAPTHTSIALQLIEADKDVLVEKPLSMTVADGMSLVEAAERRGRILMVGHVLEYHPAIRKLKSLVADGAFGRIRYIYSNRLNLGRIRTEENALWSFAPHDIAIMTRLLDSTPEETASHGGAYLNSDVADVTLTNLRFPNGVQGHIFVSWLHPFKEHRFVVVGARQMAVFDDTLPWDQKLTLYPHSVDWVDGQVPVANRADATAVPLDEIEPLGAECEDFLTSIATRQQPLTDGESGLRVLRVLEAAQRSLVQAGQPVAISSNAHSPKPSHIYPTATVDPGAIVGEGTSVWHHAHVMAGATVGKDCMLGQNVFVGSNVRVGDSVRIQNNVSVYEGVELEDYVFCGPSMVFTNDINPRVLHSKGGDFLPTKVRFGASIGANATVLCGITIGRHAFIGAGAVVTADVPDYGMVYGTPAELHGWMCECGTKLHFEAEHTCCSDCQREYELVLPDRVVSKMAVAG